MYAKLFDENGQGYSVDSVVDPVTLQNLFNVLTNPELLSMFTPNEIAVMRLVAKKSMISCTIGHIKMDGHYGELKSENLEKVNLNFMDNDNNYTR